MGFKHDNSSMFPAYINNSIKRQIFSKILGYLAARCLFNCVMKNVLLS